MDTIAFSHHESSIHDAESENDEAIGNQVYEKPMVQQDEGSTSLVAWLFCICIMVVNTVCAWMWVTTASAPLSFATWMNVDYAGVNWLSNVSAIFNTVFSLIAGWSYERFGIKKSVGADDLYVIKDKHEPHLHRSFSVQRSIAWAAGSDALPRLCSLTNAMPWS